MEEKKIEYKNSRFSLIRNPEEIIKIKSDTNKLKLIINDKYEAIRNKSQNLYIGIINENVNLYPVDYFYKTKRYEETNFNKKSGINLKMDINYYLSLCEQEQKELEIKRSDIFNYKFDENNDEFEIKSYESNITLQSENLKKYIKDARIVNFSKLKRFGNVDLITNILNEMCVKLKGRFVLKNSFYERKLRNLRDKLIGLIENSESLYPEDLYFLKDDKFLATELLDYDGEKYTLKLKSENDVIKKNGCEYDEKKIKIIMRKNMILCVDELCSLTGLETETVMCLMNHFYKVNENTIAFVDDEIKDLRIFVLDLLKEGGIRKNQILKSYEEINGVELNQNVLQKILKDYCNNKGGRWYLRYDE